MKRQSGPYGSQYGSYTTFAPSAAGIITDEKSVAASVDGIVPYCLARNLRHIMIQVRRIAYLVPNGRNLCSII